MTRKTRRSPILAVASMALAIQTASAVQNEDMDFKTTEDLYQLCSVASSAPEYIAAIFACRGFIDGAVQYHDAVSDRKHLKRLICYPKTATLEDGRRVFVAWAKKHLKDDQLMNEMPVIGLVRALAEKYPCD